MLGVCVPGPGPGQPYRRARTFCTIILRSIIVKYFTKSGYLYLRVPQTALSPQIARNRNGVMFMLRCRGCPNEIAIIWS